MAGSVATPAPRDPMDETVLRSFFTKDDDGTWRCIVGETDEFECKEGFMTEVRAAIDALTGLAEDDVPVFDFAADLIRDALGYWASNPDPNLLGAIRKAAARLDELTFGPLVCDE